MVPQRSGSQLETKRLIRDGEKGGGGWVYGCGERGRLYTYRYTVTTRMTSALRWAATRVVVCGHCAVTLSLTINETLKWLSSLPILTQETLWW